MTIPLVPFRAWVKDHGVSSSLVPKESRGKGTGLFIDHDQDPQHVEGSDQGELLFIPRPLLLSRSRVLQLQSLPLQRTFEAIGLDNLTERLALILFLVFRRLTLQHKECDHETAYANGSSDESDADPMNQISFFDPYIAILPDISTPVTLDPELVRGYLAGTLLLDSVCAKRSKLESEFELLSGNLDVFEDWPVHPSLDNYIWADATFWSRVLSFGTQLRQDQDSKEPENNPPEDLHMVPFLDFANHATEPNIRWEVDADGLRAWAKPSFMDQVNGDEQSQSKSHEQEAFLSYGSKPNMELLFLYGFTLQDNPTQFLTLPMPMDEDDPYYMPKAHTLMRLGIPPRIAIYLDTNDGPEDLVKLCDGLWITQESQYLLWIYSLNEEDGLGALIEEPTFKVCLPDKAQDIDNMIKEDEMMEEADIIDEDTVGRLLLTVQDTRIVSKELLHMTIPKLEIYPVLILRSLVLVATQIEIYITRIMETGDKVQKVLDAEIVSAINYDIGSPSDAGSISSSKDTEVPAAKLRRNTNVGECLIPTLLEPDHEHPITTRQVEAEALVLHLASTMKSYRNEEMSLLVHIGNILGEAQTRALEESEFIQAYLSRMQNDEAKAEALDKE
ncbi:hypothetical protein BC939DRAFT_458045 [Gamsiella multidivaricata]|uniref:uncharacterized protein n=1 Tax=Gamsiella multidivaricata TaxID=101098 RepID=UPI00221E5C08|nr:uncharacterized protein BC939DRAFT_458045 [Gamsiella multidivaricata]KAG0351968.1 hypothetical protein BGZ54_003006 [Gamsiella multidivaricata]KAI7820463.1 hypothetical protein BC939DRAFT_458045 [Gamsiella multidivaricata]